MSASPKVSVIMPVYNRTDLLPRSLGTVFAQSYSNFELIVVDDGSTEDVQRVVTQYNDPRLQYVRFDHNCGIGAARAEGVIHATGEWIAFLDSDDLWLPEKLTVDLTILARHPEIDILFDNYRNINDMQQIEQVGFDQMSAAFNRLQTTLLEADVFRVESGLPQTLLIANLIGTASIITLRRAVFEKAGNFNLTLSGPEDFEMMWRAALSGAIFAYNRTLLVERHKDTGSITARLRLFIPRYLTALDICEESARRAGRFDLLEALNQARKRSWRNLLHACALEGRRLEAWQSFRNSIRYGVSVEAFMYMIAALAGPTAIFMVKRLAKGLGI